MRNLKARLCRESGSSMLLVLVFLMFSMFVGSALLSSAAANSARAAETEQNRQDFLRRRSAMLVLRELLADMPQLTIRDVTTASERTVTFSIPDEEISCMQGLLYEYAAARYAAEHFVAAGDMEFVNFSSAAAPESAGTVEIVVEYEDFSESIQADYALSGNGDLWIGLPGLQLTVSCTAGTGAPVTVTLDEESTTTVTTVIHWGDPVIGKGGTG